MSNNSLGGMNILVRVIHTFYDLGEVGMPEAMPLAHQRRHRKIIVPTERGRFLAKTYRRDPYVLDALRFQHRLSDHLAANDLPVARIQPSKTGHRIVEVDDWALELQEFVEGEPMEISGGALAISAQALGRFHEVCRDFPRPERDARLWRFGEVSRTHLGRLYRRAREEGEAAEADALCDRIAVFLHDAGQALSFEVRDTFETGLIHGDWHSGNLIFHDGKLCAIVDLEFAGDGCYLEDLSYALSNLCIRTSTQSDRLARRTDIMLNEYQRYRALSFAEETALYYAVGIKQVATVTYQTAHMEGLLAGLTSFQWLKHLALQCDWLESRARRSRWG